jgi:hypothetical protein
MISRRFFNSRKRNHARFAFLLLLFNATLAYGQLFPNLGGQREGISSYQFLKIGAGGRAVAMGETFTAVANDVSALYWNPAGLTQFSQNQFMIAHTEYLVDIKHEFFGAAYHLSPTDAVGFSLTSLHMEDMPVTTEAQPFGTGRYFRFADLAAGATYSRKMTDQFSFGLTVRYVQETLDVLRMRGVMIDLGTYYWTGIGTTRFAIVVSNFGPDVSPSGTVTEYSTQQVSSFQSFSPPTQFKMGFAMEPYQQENQRITTSFELQHPNDNAENLHIGVEYGWHEIFFLRAGIRRTIGEPLFGSDNTNSGDVTFGAGVSAPISFTNLNVDYAFSNFNLLGGVHRISLEMTF